MSDSQPRILGIAGSLRQGSYSGAVLRGLQEAAVERARIETFSLAPVPMYNADLDGEHKPEPVMSLKNALDWASRPGYQSVLKDKPVLIMTSSPGMVGGVRAQAQLRQTLAATLSRVIAAPEVLISQVQTKIQDGRLTDPTSLKFMLEALDALLTDIRRRDRMSPRDDRRASDEAQS